MYWTGRLIRNGVVIIDVAGASRGETNGDFLPGIPVGVRMFSKAIDIVEKPSRANDWKRVSFRCLKNTKGSVTVNIRWYLLR